MFNKVREYIKDSEFKLILFTDRLYVTNYQEILSLEDEKISLLVNNKRIIIKGKNLTLTKLLDKEILVAGQVVNIEVSDD